MIPLSTRDSEIVAGLDPLMRSPALRHRQLCLDAGMLFSYESGLRSRSEQQRQVDDPARKTPAAPAGHSMHEVGMAYDFSGPRNDAEWLKAGELAESIGLKWGGRFKPQADRVHVEAPITRDQAATYRQVIILGLGLSIGLAVVVASK